METSSALFELASVSLACRDQDTLLKTFAARVGTTLGARAVFVWIHDSESEGLVCRTRWTETGERIVPSIEPVTEGPLAIVFESASTSRLTAQDLSLDDLEHLEETSRVRVKSAMFASLPGVESPEGVVEVLNKRAGNFTEQDAHFLEEAARLAGQALTNLEAIEGERHAQLATLERLTALYDLGPHVHIHARAGRAAANRRRQNQRYSRSRGLQSVARGRRRTPPGQHRGSGSDSGARCERFRERRAAR